MLARMSSREITEWQEFYKREPFGEEWKQVAYLCSLIANGLLKKKDGGQWTPNDFYPIKIVETLRQQSDDEIEAVLKAALIVAKPPKPKKKK